MSARVLGPAGVLPPGEWAVGAVVRNHAEGGVVFARCDGGRVAVIVDEEARTAWRAEQAALDLTEGCLSFACRALLHLVAPDVPQPDCAPVWRAVAQAGGVTRWGLWVGVSMVWTFDCAETNPRRALALALEAAAGE